MLVREGTAKAAFLDTLMGYFWTLPADGGRDSLPTLPLPICKTTGPILDLRMGFDVPGLKL